MGAIDGRRAARHGAFAVAMGIVGAAASVVLCVTVGFAADLSARFPWLLFLLPLLAVASLLLYRILKLPLDTTTRSVVEAMRADEPISPALAPGILLGTALSIAGGASVGKEAGALHMGASLGDLVARPFRLKSMWRADERAGRAEEGMAACAAATGMAATFAALFFAPLGATAFVLELARTRRAVLRHSPSILAACLVAFVCARAIGIGDVIPKVPLPALDWTVAGQGVLVALAAAAGGALYGRAIEGSQALTGRLSKNYYLWAALGSAAFAALVTLGGWQAFEGTGGNQLAAALDGRAEPWGFAVKGLLTVVCLGCWLRGGEIMPTFATGALLGATCADLMGVGGGWCAAVGLVAFFAAMSRCPVAAFLMGCEIFGFAGAPLFAVAAVVPFLLVGRAGYYGKTALKIAGRRLAGRDRAS